MTDNHPEALRTECETLTRYLIGQAPSSHVVSKYLEAHALDVVSPPQGLLPIDSILILWARRGGWRIRVADVHARFFARTGFLRRKLVLLLAILETDGEGRRAVDVADGKSLVTTLLRLVGWGVRTAFFLLLGSPVLMVAASLQAEPGSVTGEGS